MCDVESNGCAEGSGCANVDDVTVSDTGIGSPVANVCLCHRPRAVIFEGLWVAQQLHPKPLDVRVLWLAREPRSSLRPCL